MIRDRCRAKIELAQIEVWCEEGASWARGIYDAEIVSSARLFGVIAQRADRKARFEAAQRLTGEQNPAEAMLHRILYAGRSLSREEFHAFAWLAPVLTKIFYGLYVEGLANNAIQVLSLRKKRKALSTPKLLAGYEQRFFRLGNLAMLFALQGRRVIDAGEIDPKEAYERLVADLLELRTLGAAVRSLWVAAKLGNSILQSVKRTYLAAKTPVDLVFAAGPLVAIAARHANLRTEIVEALGAPLLALEPTYTTVAASFQARVVGIAKQIVPKKEDADFMPLRLMGLVRYGQLSLQLPEGSPFRVVHFEQLQPELACAVLADSIEPLKTEDAYWEYLQLAPLVALQDAESFFLPSALLGALARKWTPGSTIKLARAQTGYPDPVRVPPRPGRNDPCPCGSDKKYKHCHGA